MRSARGAPLAAATIGFAALLSAGAVSPQAVYPAHPIKLIVAYPPAGAADVLARLLAARIASATGWT